MDSGGARKKKTPDLPSPGPGLPVATKKNTDLRFRESCDSCEHPPVKSAPVPTFVQFDPGPNLVFYTSYSVSGLYDHLQYFMRSNS